MTTLKQLTSLCKPAQLYLGMSVLIVLSQCYQNIGTPHIFTCGLMKASSPINNVFFLTLEILYVLGWTYILNILCKCGHTKISWLLILSSLVSMFLFIGLTIVTLRRIRTGSFKSQLNRM
jgi:hypothetical protein